MKFLLMFVAPIAGQDEAGRSDSLHFAIRAARGENAENARNVDFLSFHKGAEEVCRTVKNMENADEWPYDDWPDVRSI